MKQWRTLFKSVSLVEQYRVPHQLQYVKTREGRRNAWINPQIFITAQRSRNARSRVADRFFSWRVEKTNRQTN